MIEYVETIIRMADSYIGVFEFGGIIHTGNCGFSLGHDAVIVNVLGQHAGLCMFGWRIGGLC